MGVVHAAECGSQGISGREGVLGSTLFTRGRAGTQATVVFSLLPDSVFQMRPLGCKRYTYSHPVHFCGQSNPHRPALAPLRE